MPAAPTLSLPFSHAAPAPPAPSAHRFCSEFHAVSASNNYAWSFTQCTLPPIPTPIPAALPSMVRHCDPSLSSDVHKRRALRRVGLCARSMCTSPRGECCPTCTYPCHAASEQRPSAANIPCHNRADRAAIGSRQQNGFNFIIWLLTHTNFVQGRQCSSLLILRPRHFIIIDFFNKP